MKLATPVALLILCAALSPVPGDAASWCTKVTTLNGLAERFPDNAGPDIVVRVDLGESIQYAIDVATDRNGDGYIIVGAVNSGIGAPYGTTAQRVVIDREYSLPFGLFGCSLSLRIPHRSMACRRRTSKRLPRPRRPVRDGPPRDRQRWWAGGWRATAATCGMPMPRTTGSVTCSSATAIRSTTARRRATATIGVLVAGDGNTVKDTRVTESGSHGIEVTGDNNALLKNLVGDRNKGNGGAGITLQGVGNLVQENKVYASGADGIMVTGGTAASPNIIRQNVAGDKLRGNGGNGIHILGDIGNGAPNALEIEKNTVRANTLNGILVAAGATGHELKGNVGGDTSPELNNGDCEFLVAAGNLNATGNKANGVTIPGADGTAFPTTCIGTP